MNRFFSAAARSVICLLPSIVMAQEVDSDEQYFFPDDSKYSVHIGMQVATLKPGGLGVYTENLHNNGDSRGTGGIYVSGSAMLSDAYFIQADLSHLTRWSGSIEVDFHRLSVGRRYGLGGRAEAFISIGGAQTMAARKNQRLRIGEDELTTVERTRTKQSAAMGRVEIGWVAAPRVYMAPSYSYIDLSGGGMHRFDLESQLAVNKTLSFALNYNYTHWDRLRQPGWRLGMIFRF